MIDKGKQNILGVMVNAIDYEAAVDRIISAARQRQGLAVTALAVHAVMTGVLDAPHRYRLNHLDLVVPDGQPVRWALNLLHHTGLVDRVYGPTLMLKVCKQAELEHLPIYLFGSRPETLGALTQKLRTLFPNLIIAGMQPSRFRQLSRTEQQELAETIRASGAAITFVGLGCPRQEIWTYEYRALLPMPVIAVGAAYDFHAGSVPQAPERLQLLGLEWLFRLFQEPRRLWKRYLLFNPLYLGLLALQATGLKRFDPLHDVRPIQELRYG